MIPLPTPDPNTISEADFDETWGAYVRDSGDFFSHADVLSKNLHEIWTIVEAESDEGMYTHLVALPGFHVVNNVGYCLTAKPWETGLEQAYWFFDDIPKEDADADQEAADYQNPGDAADEGTAAGERE